MTTRPTASFHFARIARSKCEAVLWAIHRADGVVLNFTDHDQPLDFTEPGEPQRTFTPVGGASESAEVSEGGLRHKNFEIRGILTSSAITENDLAAGRYDHAEIRRYVVNWRFTFLGLITFDKFIIGNITEVRGAWRAEIQGTAVLLNQPVGGKHQKDCENEWGDDRCTVDRSQYRRQSAQVSAVTSKTKFQISTIPSPDGSPTERSPIADGHFNQGRIEWTSGANAGFTSEIKTYTHTSPAKEFILQYRTPFNIAVTDTFNLWQGCGFTFGSVAGEAHSCSDFGNQIHYGGELYVPSSDEARSVPRRFGTG